MAPTQVNDSDDTTLKLAGDAPTASATASATAAVTDSAVPDGFVPLRMGGDYIELNGPIYVRVEAGQLQLGFRVEKRHTNPMGICHGGWMASFADMVLPISVHHQNKELRSRFLPTISLQLDYLAPGSLGAWVQGTGQLLRHTKSLVFAQGLITVDGEPAVRMSGVFKIGPPFEFRKLAAQPASTHVER